MRIAVCQWDPAVTAETVNVLKAQGVTAVEAGPAFLPAHDRASLLEAAELFRNADIDICTIHAPLGDRIDLSDPDDARREATLAVYAEALAGCALSGAECLVIHPGTQQAHDRHDRRLQQLRRSLETLLETARSSGVLLALENMPGGSLGDDSRILRRIIDYFDSEFLGLCFDVGHAHLSAEGVNNAFAAMRERIINLHLEDNDGNYDIHLQPPYGTVDWTAFAVDYRTLQLGRPATVEAQPWNGAGWAVLLREVEALFTRGPLTVKLDGQDVRVVCSCCGRFLFGTPDDWFCSCGLRGDRHAGAANSGLA